MKNIVTTKTWIWLLLLSVFACSPQEYDEYSLKELGVITDSQVSFTRTASPKSNNLITFTNTTPLPMGEVYTIRWDLGNGSSGNGTSAVGLYPFAGEYTVTLSIYSANGMVARKSEVVSIAKDDYSLVDTPVYRNLTGGAENAEGKTWVFDQYNNFAKEVATATGFNISGHMGLGPQGSRGQEWWGAAANDKRAWQMYSTKFTFIQNGVQLKIQKEGNEGYGRNASAASVGGFTVHAVEGDDAYFTYSGGEYTFSIDEAGEFPVLTISGNGYMGYYAGSQDYEVIYLTDRVMALRVNNTIEGQDWVFVYCLEALNVEAPKPPKELKSIPLSEDFEGDTYLNLVQEDMGNVSRVVDNPLPLPINTSDKVFRYWKSGGFYSNLSFTAPDYKFDLTAQNKIRVKVYIPSYNDYETEHGVAGPWIVNGKLRPQLAVKLQDSEHPAPWEGQTEIVKANLELDKWLELEFDFSGVANRKDYDRIVIQFGAEGHAGTGFFFFDDFAFDE